MIGDTCLGSVTQFKLKSNVGINAVSWSFGDPASGANNSANGFTVGHTFSQAGNYNITAIVTTNCGVDTLFLHSFQIIDCNVPCSGSITSVDTCLQSNIPFAITTTATIFNATWSFGDPASGANNTSSLLAPTHQFSAPGLYNVVVDVTADCGNFQATYPIQIINCQVICEGTIQSSDSCLSSGTSFQIVSDSTVTSAVWDFGDPASGITNVSTSLAPTHLFSAVGTYTVRSIVSFSCGIDTLFETISIVSCDTAIVIPPGQDCQILIPNAFSANEDGLNDQIYPITDCNFEYFQFLVFNKWGEQVFEAKNPTDKWDGKYKGSDSPIGVYGYLITYKLPSQTTRNTYGTFTLIR